MDARDFFRLCYFLCYFQGWNLALNTCLRKVV